MHDRWTSTGRQSRLLFIEALCGHEVRSPLGDDPFRGVLRPRRASGLCWTRRARRWWWARFRRPQRGSFRTRLVRREDFRSWPRPLHRPFCRAFLWRARKEFCFLATFCVESGACQFRDSPAVQSRHRPAATIASAASHARRSVRSQFIICVLSPKSLWLRRLLKSVEPLLLEN